MEQNTGRTSNVIVWILKIILLFLTAIFGLSMNIGGGLALIIQNEGQGLENYSDIFGVGLAMIIVTTICFIGGTVLVMLNKSLIAAGVSTVGTIAMLVLYAIFCGLNIEGGSELFVNHHLPTILITIVTIIIAAIQNWHKLFEAAQRRQQRVDRAAPSILGGTYQAAGQENTRKKKRARRNTADRADNADNAGNSEDEADEL